MRIAIVNDMPIAVEALRRTLAQRDDYELAWVAHDGATAVDFCASDIPDLVLMDLVMPGMDGVEATRRIMRDSPCAILIVTVNVGANAAGVFEAMGHGALDAVDTPALSGAHARDGIDALLAKIDAVGHLIREPQRVLAEHAQAVVPKPRGGLVAIGASAGGPAAVAELLSGLNKDFSAAVVVVQHIDAQFAQGMADWLSQKSSLPVRLAHDNDTPAPGVVLLAGGAQHLILKNGGVLGYTSDPVDYVYRPSVDVFFDSVARVWPGKAVGVLLTGMGRDGAQGLKSLRDHGSHTIAQDEATSAVYGMPKAAAALGAAVDILPLPKIAGRLNTLFVATSNSQRRRA